MPDIKNINVDDVLYDIKDETARAQIGDISALKTTAKDDLVAAINELKETTPTGDSNNSDCLPTVTDDDNGKVLKVVGGAWAVASSDSNENVIFERTVSGFELDSNYGAFTPGYVSPPEFILEDGETYWVKWNDDEPRECVAYSFVNQGYTLVAIGNGSGLGLAGNGEPFFMTYNVTYNNSQIFADIEGESHTVKIYQIEEANELPAVTTEDNGKILQVVDGAWSTVTPEFDGAGTADCDLPDSTVSDNGKVLQVVNGEPTWQTLTFEEPEPELPAVTDTDNGKVLQVVNGEPKWETIENSGSTESDLPAVTAADNDKFLRVVNGAWAAVSVSIAEEASF